MNRALPRSFYSRRALEVAPDLLGRTLVRTLPSGDRLAVRIVETEAYEPEDPASHAFAGRTERNAVMFGEPGHLYLYFVYGMHWCANVVTGARGEGSAVLLRAGAPIEGLSSMLRHRRGRTPLTSGPARLAQALTLERADNGMDLCERSACWLEAGQPIDPDAIATGPRIGVRKAADRPWRYWERGDPHVSAPRALRDQVLPRP